MTDKQLLVRPVGNVAKLADKFMYPVMKLIMLVQSVSWKESPQLTHFWNNQKHSRESLEHLSRKLMVAHAGISQSRNVPGIERHLRWKRYYVLEPIQKDIVWHVGWRYSDGSGGVTRLLVKRSVRVLVDEGSAEFFGISARWNVQIPIKKIGEGSLGRKAFADIPLI